MSRKRLITSLVLVVAALLWTGTVAAAYRAIRRFETTLKESATAPRACRPANGSRERTTCGRW